MSSFDTAREKWELYHMKERDKVNEAAANGDPEAMEILAYHINKIEYNCRDKVIELLTAASDAGRETASWKLADLYAYFKYLGDDTMLPKIEQYCMRAFEADVPLHTKDLLYQNLLPFIKYNHPEWFEMYKIILET